MARMEITSPFNPDTYPGKVVGLATSLGDHDSGLHQHERGQLLYARQGCIRVEVGQYRCLLPPSRAVWIPGGMPHRAIMRKVVDYRSVWFDSSLCAELPDKVCVLEVVPLLGELLEPMALAGFDQDWDDRRFDHLIGLSIHEICTAPRQPMLLPMPQDRRLTALTRQPDIVPPELNELAATVGATGKTIGRIFQRETGMTYQQWRQQWRVLRAVELLLIGHPVSYTSTELGFSSDSAFITFFKQMLGCTPGTYLRQ